MEGKMNLYYDEEGDYLEIFIEGQSPTYGEDVENGITLFKKESTDEIVGIGILNFRKKAKSLDNIRLNLPFNVNFSSLKV
ncbi:MAG: DUF2283 domain-containing protein [Candidatus Pacearchaeota archaeon]